MTTILKYFKIEKTMTCCDSAGKLTSFCRQQNMNLLLCGSCTNVGGVPQWLTYFLEVNAVFFRPNLLLSGFAAVQWSDK